MNSHWSGTKSRERNKNYLSKVLLVAVLAILFLGALTWQITRVRNRSVVAARPTAEMTRLPQSVEAAAANDQVPHSNVLPEKTTKLPILMYHYVEYVRDPRDTIRKSLNVYPPTFDAEVKTLLGAGYTFITMSDLVDRSRALPAKPIVMTFDDGYRDFYTEVFPVLKKYHVRAVAYIVPGFINMPNNMDRWQIEEIIKSGLVEIGAHTVHHVYLKGMREAIARDEIVKSKMMLEQEFRIPVTTFAYPYGAFDLQTIKLVKDAGFASAVSTIQGVDVGRENQFYLFRIRPGARTGTGLTGFLDQLER